MRRRRAGIVAIAVLFAGGPSIARAGPPSVEAFARKPAADHVVLSPAGTHYAALQWIEGREYLLIRDLTAADPDNVLRIELEMSKRIEEKADSIRWLNDRTIGVVLRFEGNRLGVPTPETRLFAIERDLSDVRLIPQPPSGSMFHRQLQHHILDYLPEDPKHVLMALDRRGSGQFLDVYKVNILSGELLTEELGTESVADYLVDQQGRVRLRTKVHKQSREIEVRRPAGKAWRNFAKVGRQEDFPLSPVAFAADPNRLLVVKTSDRGIDELFEYDLEESRLGRKVFGHPDVDFDSLEIDPYTRKVIGVGYTVDQPAVHYLDEELAAIQRSIDLGLPETTNEIRSFDRERKRFVVLAAGPRFPGTFYLYHREQNELHKLGDRYPDRLGPDDLRDVEPIRYPTRDGLSIPGYLTRPAGAGPFPTVVLPHGGPASRDYRRFDYLGQFLASRGYAVLQPNFRGSTGYGVRFETAGHEQWGLAMQDDLTDGVRAMIERGVADPERICIVGWSYGGYAALMGAVKTPGLFRCAVAGAAVTDLPRILSEHARYKFGLKNQRSLGDAKEDRARLEATSPVRNVAAFKIPLLLVHGDKDLSVPVGHSKRLASKLGQAGKPHTLVILEDGDHHLSLDRNRIRFLEELELFLDRHIGAESGFGERLPSPNR